MGHPRDDCDAPHEKRISIHSFTDPAQFAKKSSSGYLPSVAGVAHSWPIFNTLMAKIECSWGLTAIDFIPVALQYEDFV